MKKFLFGVLIGALCVAGYMAYQGQKPDEQTADGTIVLEIEASPDATADVMKDGAEGSSLPEAAGTDDAQTELPETAVTDDVQADTTPDEPADDLPQNADEVQELAKQFDVELSQEDAQKLVDTMEKLEELGVSPDVVKEKATELYQKYGKDCVEHVQEAVTDAVKGAAENAAQNFADDVKQSVSNTVSGFLNSIK